MFKLQLYAPNSDKIKVRCGNQRLVVTLLLGKEGFIGHYSKIIGVSRQKRNFGLRMGHAQVGRGDARQI